MLWTYVGEKINQHEKEKPGGTEDYEIQEEA